MRILVTGAGGFIGGHIVRALQREGHQVVACTRGGKLEGVETVECDFAIDHDPQTWKPRLKNIDAVINAVGIIRETRSQRFTALHRDAPRALFAACEAVGVRRVIQISALGADAGAESAYHLTKRAADEDLAGRDLDWLILRPSIVYGPGAQSSSFFRALAALPLTPVIDRGDQRLQPIHIDDFVRAVVSSLKTGAPARALVDCVGPHPLRFMDLLDGWRRWLGEGQLRPVSVPYGLALLAGRVGGLVGGMPMDADAVRMLQRGNQSDVEPFVAQFGFRPRAFEQALQRVPAMEADRWHARLFFLGPFLRVSLAVFWIWTGLTSAFLYPIEESYAMLAAVGFTGVWAKAALYGAAALDGALGLALLAGWRVQLIGTIQIGLMLGYTALISIGLPSLWLHPFGPVAKNLPLLAATLVMIVLGRRQK